MKTHIQADTANGANFLHGQRRQDAINGFHPVRWRASAEDRRTGKHANFDLIAVSDSDANIELGI